MKISRGNLNDTLFRMQHNVNQTMWKAGQGVKTPGGWSQIGMNLAASEKKKPSKKKKKKYKNGVPEEFNKAAPGGSQDADFQGSELPEGYERQDPEAFGVVQENSLQDAQNYKKNRLEHQMASARADKTDGQRPLHREWNAADPVTLQNAIMWAEILGEPVSVKRRKKRVNQFYGN